MTELNVVDLLKYQDEEDCELEVVEFFQSSAYELGRMWPLTANLE